MGLFLMGIKYQLEKTLPKLSYFIANLSFGVLMVFSTWSDRLLFYVSSIVYLTTVLIYLTMNNVSLMWINYSINLSNSSNSDYDDYIDLSKWCSSYIQYSDLALCLSIILMAFYGNINQSMSSLLIMAGTITIVHIALTIRRIKYVI